MGQKRVFVIPVKVFSKNSKKLIKKITIDKLKVFSKPEYDGFQILHSF